MGFRRPLMTFANSLDPDEAQQNVGPHLGSKLVKTKIKYQLTYYMEKQIFFAIFERFILLSMQRVTTN